MYLKALLLAALAGLQLVAGLPRHHRGSNSGGNDGVVGSAGNAVDDATHGDVKGAVDDVLGSQKAGGILGGGLLGGILA